MNTQRSIRILGIDPGLQLTGYGVIDYLPLRPVLVDAGVIRLKARTSIAERLVELEHELDAILIEHTPQIVAVEKLYSHYAHPQTAVLMGHARGVILLTAARKNLRVEELAANRIKQSLTGPRQRSRASRRRRRPRRRFVLREGGGSHRDDHDDTTKSRWIRSGMVKRRRRSGNAGMR
jgi:crossover junction endodeoxyribonuclease RuvC